jgi:hypothetical protein
MISSEVQRTLVKSPPELWAELSDPTSLGRHLGELGDIQITAVEPETKVEWQAQDTSGTVLIKPSGWGTKVTLSVTRELTAVPEPAPEEPPSAEPTSAEDVSSTEAPAAAEAQGVDPSEAAEQAAQEPDAVRDPDAAAAPEFIPGPEAVTESFDAGSEAEVATETAHEAEAEPEPVAEYEEPEATYADSAVPVAELEPRRGFLARLFRRRAPERLAPAPAPRVEATEPIEAAETIEEGPDAPGVTLPPTSDAQESEQPTTAIEALQARYLVRDPAPSPGPVQAEEPVDLPEPDLSEPAMAEPIATEAIATEAIASEAAAEPAGEAQAGSEVDIAAELRAAEEAATEEVTAVLTAALDRLGAAHHRPFSRS